MRVAEIDKPVPLPHEALIKIESVGICGSDLHYYTDGRIGNSVATPPLILGHEYAGVVEDVGADADRDLIGKRVAVEPGIPCLKCEHCRKGNYNVCPDMSFPGGPGGCQGVLCEYAVVHADFCFPVPDSIGPVEAAMLEPLAVAVHTIELAQLSPGDSVAILGLGPIGLLCAEVARISGAGVIIGTDLKDYRLEAGKRCGVDVVFNADKVDSATAIMEETGGRGVDVVIDAARSSDTLGIACLVARPAGRCVFVGISGEEVDPIPVGAVRRKELCLQWCRRFKFNFPAAISMIERGIIDVKPIVTHSFSLEETREAFEIVSGFQDGVLKASVDLF